MEFSRNLSIVIQGAVKPETDFRGYSTIDVLSSARSIYPYAEIIYSGWNGSVLPRPIYKTADRVILSEDPGPLICGYGSGGPLFENINRQIVSTVSGIEASSKSIIIKSRSDALFVGNLAASIENCIFSNSENRNRVFKRKVIVSNIYTRLFFFEFGGFRRSLGHVSDLFHCGYREDILKFWKGPLLEPLEFQYSDVTDRATMEQLLFNRFLCNQAGIENRNTFLSKYETQICGYDFERFLEFVRANFCPLSEKSLGIKFPRRFVRLGISKWLFEDNESIRAYGGHRGLFHKGLYITRLLAVFLEYQIKFSCKRILSKESYSRITESLYSLSKRTKT